MLLELLWPKQRILQTYLNIAQFGPRVYGVEAAARVHFGVRASDLDERQAALLAAMLPAPNRYQPSRPGAQLTRRAKRVRSAMRQLGPGYLEALKIP